MKTIILSAISTLVISAASTAQAGWFDSEPSSDKAMSQKAEAQSKQIDQSVGFPSVVNGFEKRMVRMLYEKRDDPNYRTYSYIVTMTGQFVKICDSVGFGINASIQFSNPERVYQESGMDGRPAVMIPQAEPNGLFMPEGLAATYVLCIDNQKEELVPVYVEPELIVSPFELSQ